MRKAIWLSLAVSYMAPFKVKINAETCIGCGVCVSMAPDVFEMGEEGKSVIVEKWRTGDSPYEGEVTDEGLKDTVKTAADSCPTNSITVEE